MKKEFNYYKWLRRLVIIFSEIPVYDREEKLSWNHIIYMSSEHINDMIISLEKELPLDAPFMRKNMEESKKYIREIGLLENDNSFGLLFGGHQFIIREIK